MRRAARDSTMVRLASYWWSRRADMASEELWTLLGSNITENGRCSALNSEAFRGIAKKRVRSREIA